MRSKSLPVRLLALAFAMVLVVAACGDDDDPEGSGSGGESTESTEGGGGGAPEGSLAGWRGTTPAPETTDAVEAFQARMDEADPDLQDYNYGPEAYDAVMMIALAAEIAGTDGIEHASEIVGVSKDGESCGNWEDCKALIDAGTDIDYNGVSGPQDMSGNGEPVSGSYAVLEFGEDNRIDDSKTTFKKGDAPPEVNDIPLTEVEGSREGDGVLKIGTLLPETGSLAFLGPPEIAGVKVAIEEINAAGGVLGQPVESTFSDSGDTSTDIATQSVNRLLDENVDAIVGAASSSVTLSVIDTVVNAGVTMFSPANTSSTLSDYEDKGLYFRDAPPDIIQGKVLAEVLAEDGHSSIYILNLDDAYGNGLAENLTTSFEESGGEVIAATAYDPQAQTFEAEVGEAAGADPDAVVVIGFEESARIVAEMIKQGIGPADIPVYGTDGNMGNATGETFEAGE
jgi:ABC-type branched-subunit amino acid transport system substrate-binding protein